MRILMGAALGAATLAALSSPAMAQSGEAEFNGPYIGASVGYGFRGNDVGESIQFDRDLNGSFGDTITTTGVPPVNAFGPGFCNGAATGTANFGCSNDKDDIEYHVRAGWDVPFGNVVVGVVGEFGKGQVRDSVSAFSTTPASYTMTREIDWDANLRLRAGYALGGKTLFYATGGAAYASFDNSFTTSNTANTFTTSDNKTNSWGWTAGGGVEQKIGQNFSVGLEYLYTRYLDDDYTVRASGGPATSPFTQGNAAGTDFRRSNDNFNTHAVRATAAFRF